MTSHSTQGLGTKLFYQQTLPFRWKPVELPDSNEQRHHQHRVNERLIKAVLLIAEGSLENKESSQQDPVQQLLQLKVDLLIDLFSELLSLQIELPIACPVTLNTHGLSWLEPEKTPTVGSAIVVEIYLHASIPKPVQFYATVTDVVVNAKGTLCSACWLGLDDAEQQQLDKLIFRNHRQMIAKNRNKPIETQL